MAGATAGAETTIDPPDDAARQEDRAVLIVGNPGILHETAGQNQETAGHAAQHAAETPDADAHAAPGPDLGLQDAATMIGLHAEMADTTNARMGKGRRRRIRTASTP